MLPSSTDGDILAFLDELGVRPGVRIEVREKHPFDGPIVVRVDGEDRTLGDRVANHIYVRPIVDPPAVNGVNGSESWPSMLSKR